MFFGWIIVDHLSSSSGRAAGEDLRVGPGVAGRRMVPALHTQEG